MARITPRPPKRGPLPHPSGARPPELPPELIPQHVAIVMDGNGRWARQRGLRRTEGHARGEDALFDVIEGAIEMGIPYLSAYAFSTENWKRSPD
ncbi:undecaprenyl diphosphate synthase family protein, partial [Cronobacter sakazakii]|nr:undecaprenyl diphosphate synthase family protein [Cronobacter sakazakii]